MMALMANVAGSANGYMLTNDANIRTAVKVKRMAVRRMIMVIMVVTLATFSLMKMRILVSE